MKNLNIYEINYITNNSIKINEENNKELFDFKQTINELKEKIDVKKYIQILWNKINKYIKYNNKKLEEWNKNKKIIFEIIDQNDIKEDDLIINEKDKNSNIKNYYIKIFLHNKYKLLLTNSDESVNYNSFIIICNKENLIKIMKMLKEIGEWYKRYFDFNKKMKKIQENYYKKIWNTNTWNKVELDIVLLLKMKYFKMEYLSNWIVFVLKHNN